MVILFGGVEKPDKKTLFVWTNKVIWSDVIRIRICLDKFAICSDKLVIYLFELGFFFWTN